MGATAARLLVWAACFLLFVSFGARTESASITRTLPAQYIPGESFEVRLEIQPDAVTSVYAVEERWPAGWTVSVPSHGGVVDTAQGVLKWGPFLETPALVRMVTYRVQPPVEATGLASWSGQGWFNQVRVETAGLTRATRFPGELSRAVANHYLPGEPLPVRLTVRPATDVSVYAVEELIPVGWAVSGISHEGEFDAVNRQVKWGPFADPTPVVRELEYLLTPDSGAFGEVVLRGRAVFDSVAVSVATPVTRQPSRLSLVLPATFEPGVLAPVEIRMDPAAWVSAAAVELNLPTGWSATGLSDQGVLDPITGKLKWGPFTGSPPLPRVLTAQLLPPANASGEVELTGSGVFDTERQPVTGRFVSLGFQQTSRVLRSVPLEFEPDVPLTVTLTVTPRPGTPVWSVEDTLPLGWSLVGVPAGGIWDATNRKVKWGPFFAPDQVARVLSFQVRPGATAPGVARFEGRAWFGEELRETEGDLLTLMSAGRLTRSLPSRYTPGVPLSVSVESWPGPGTEAYAVEEELPAGWTFLSASEGGVFDPLQRRIKWGPFTDSLRRTLGYQVLPATDGAAEVEWVGSGVFNRSLRPTTGATTVIRNGVPRAISNSAGRIPGEAFKVSVLKILLNDSDPDGDFLTVISVSPVSDHGAEVMLTWPWIFYTPTAGYDGTDTFSYTVSDGFGGTATARVQVVVNPPPATAQNIVFTELLPDGSRRIRFAGVPGYTYHIEASTDLSTWVRLANVTAPSNGQFDYLDTEAPRFPQRYYRSLWP